jgi:PAS domain S-box-containing protein
MTALRVLIIEDSEDDATLLLRELKRGGYDVAFERVDTPAAVRSALTNQAWDVVISDYAMPAFDAPAALAILHEVGLDLPFIISSGTVGEETAVAALRAGAHDFFVKGNLVRLIPAIERELREAQVRSERRQMTEELVALYNATSGLFKADNLANLGQEIVRAVVKEFGQVDCGLLLLDKDRKRIIRIARAGNYEVHTTAALFIDGSGLVPEAVRNAETIYVPEVFTDSRYVSNNPGTQSELVVPLQTTKGILGVLDLQSPQPHAFSQRDQRILNAFAERAAAAIEIRQLYEEINGYANELEARVTTRTAELHRAKEHVEAILNNSSDAIVLARADGKIRQINPAFYNLFGYSDDDIIGKSLTMLVRANHVAKFEEAFQRIIANNQPERIELIGQRKDRTEFTFDIALAPFMEDEPSVICSLHDITQRKQLEQELRGALEKEKELNDLKSRFSSMVSHEFRTPLAMIQSSSDLLKFYSDRLDNERKLEHLDAIQLQVKRLTGLLDEILVISRAESVGLEFHLEQTDLQVFCHSIVQEFQVMAATHRVDFSVTADCLLAYIDAKLIRQALTNLLLNAVKYSSEGSTVHLMLSCTPTHALIRVTDQGIGIPEEDQKDLFEIFHRARNVGAIQGTGLGLAIVKQAVEAHGGTIGVESKIGVGTTFTITLPLMREIMKR